MIGKPITGTLLFSYETQLTFASRVQCAMFHISISLHTPRACFCFFSALCLLIAILFHFYYYISFLLLVLLLIIIIIIISLPHFSIWILNSHILGHIKSVHCFHECLVSESHIYFLTCSIEIQSFLFSQWQAETSRTKGNKEKNCTLIIIIKLTK